MRIIKGKLASAKKVVVYGPEGIGKSTFASLFPDPVFIDTEGSTKDMDVSRFEKASSWAMLMDQIRYVIQNPSICKTLVVDTIDWAEQMCISDVCARSGKKGIEDFGYGNGYVYTKEEFGRFLNLLSDVVDRGVHVVLTAHAQLRKFEQPDELGAYDRWELKLGKKTASQTSPLVKEWADMLLFANYKTLVYNVDGQGAQKGKNKAQGGRRIMHTTHHPCWDAKNRYGLPDELPFEYDAIRHVIEQEAAAPKAEPLKQEPVIEPKKNTASSAPKTPAPELPWNTEPEQPKADAKNLLFDSDPNKIPKALVDLMQANNVNEWEIQQVCEAKGYIPAGTRLDQYESISPGFIDGVLVGAWVQVFEAIKEARAKEAIPFN